MTQLDTFWDGEARWEVWARHLAPLVHDGLIDAPGERQIIDKAFTLARLLDEHLPADSREGGEAGLTWGSVLEDGLFATNPDSSISGGTE